MSAHAIFAMRYWVLSKKINHLQNKTFDKNFKVKSDIIFWLLILWSALSGVLEVWFWWEVRTI
jgi:hypothetical protein